MTLSPDDFDAFYTEVHGTRPFSWQTDVVAQVLHHGSWPALVDVPTGLGKTAMLDVAIFVTALTADISGSLRLGRRRTFFVVDRRIIVDQAHRRATHIANVLGNASTGTVADEVAKRLRGLVSVPADPGPHREEGTLLHVERMRGGVTWNSAWLRQPDHLGIVTGTVDQIGSRLFFRGYGLTPRRWPIDATMVGADALILMDEAHLATALSTTLESARSFDCAATEIDVPAPAIVQLTATSRSPKGLGWTYSLNPEAHQTDAEPVAQQRLRAGKRLELRESSKGTVAKDLADLAASAAADDGTRVLVVCNTVDRARAVQSQLAKSLAEGCSLDLLIGRSRDLDRTPLVARMESVFGAGADGPVTGSAILVATQTVEVGVDLDATALVTECAAWDALVQRFGRVNRRGEQVKPARVVVVDAGPSDSPVYGEAKDATWAFLQAQTADDGWMDASPLACWALEDVPDQCYLDQKPAPLLLPAHLDAWTRTSPRPTNDPPLESYLHGLDAGPPGVSLVWRDGLMYDGSPLPEATVSSLLEALPPRAAESVEIPLGAVRRWLANAKLEPVSDWDDADDWDDIAFDSTVPPQAIRRQVDPNGQATWAWVRVDEIRPGDQLVVPSELGGLDEFGWAPESTDPVLDVGELAAWRASKAVLRLDVGLSRRLRLAPPPDAWAEEESHLDADDPRVAEEARKRLVSKVRTWLTVESPNTHPLSDALEGVATAIADGATVDLLTAGTVILRGRSERFASLDEVNDEVEDGTVNVLGRVTLDDHQRRVGQRAAEIAASLGLNAEITRVVTDAARWHDLGKTDPRFQAMLFGGDHVQAAIAVEPLAKSGMPPGAWATRQRAKLLSRMPAGARHETWSAELVAAHVDEVGNYPHRDLLLHLVSSHHGHSRPLLPPVPENADHELEATLDGVAVRAVLPHRVDVDAAARFQFLNETYGRWGLALLETIVRCADMTISAEGS